MSEYVAANGDIVSRTDFNENSSRWGGYPQWKNKDYYSQDVLGSVIMLTDSSGNTKETYSYDVFGSQYGNNPYGYSYGNGWTASVANEYGYNGKRFDSAVGLVDYGFRDYAPQVGRFTTVDPVKDGLNWYAYVGNDPVNFIDPLGLSASDSEASSTTATMIPIVGAGITIVGGGEGSLAYVYDSEGNKGVAITGELGVGFEVDIDIPNVAGVIAGLFFTGLSNALGVTTIEGTIQDFQGPSRSAEVHVILGASQDLDNPSDTEFSVDLAVGGGAYVGYTVVIEVIDGDNK